MLNKKSLKSVEKSFKKNKLLFFQMALAIIAAFLFGMFIQQQVKERSVVATPSGPDLAKLQEEVIPKKGYVFKIAWGDLGKRMIEDGVLDEVKFTKAITGGDTLAENLKKYIDGSDQKTIELNQTNAQFWVDLLWGLGLAQKSEVLDKGPMMDGGQAGNYASTGGWTIGQKEPMQIYSKFNYIELSEEQQAIVKEIAEGVYRPCCGNSTAFPDCNHGMAALGLIELMVSQNFSKDEIYKTVLAFNSYWFPQTYLDISYHFAKSGKDYKNISAKEILSKTFSSAMGYQVIKKEVGDISWPALQQSGGSCGA